MSTDDILSAVEASCGSPPSALFLYGSYARGDYDDLSDIDVIRVTEERLASYSIGKINVTCYAAHQLIKLAQKGSLFVRHLIMEAIPLLDSEQLLSRLKRAYAQPSDYGDLFQQIKCAAPLILIPETEYDTNSRCYSATAAYLLRSYIYGKAMTLGASSFSMAHISAVIEDSRPRQAIRDLTQDRTFCRFDSVVQLLCGFLGIQPVYRRESVEAFVVNSRGSCELGMVLGLRLLARGELLDYAYAEPTA